MKLNEIMTKIINVIQKGSKFGGVIMLNIVERDFNFQLQKVLTFK